MNALELMLKSAGVDVHDLNEWSEGFKAFLRSTDHKLDLILCNQRAIAQKLGVDLNVIPDATQQVSQGADSLGIQKIVGEK